MALQEQLASDLKDAMRAGDAPRRDTLRLLLAELKSDRLARQQVALEAEVAGLRRELTDVEADEFAKRRSDTLDDEQVRNVIRRMAKRHRQSIEEFRRATREDLASHEESQLQVILAYLPAMLPAEEIEVRVRQAVAELGATSRKDMGRVMDRLAPLRDQADMSEVSKIARSLLGA